MELCLLAQLVIFPNTCGHLTIISPPRYISYTTNSPRQELFFKLQQLSHLLKSKECRAVNWLRAKGFGGVAHKSIKHLEICRKLNFLFS